MGTGWKRWAVAACVVPLAGCGCADWNPLFDHEDLEGDPPPFHICGDLPEGVDPDVAMGTPGEPEICNGVDDDCDGLVDEEDPDLVVEPPRYADEDGDTYGDPDNPLRSCTEGVEDDTDCDDTDPFVYPGAPYEQWADGLDANCDGEDDPSLCDVPPPGAEFEPEPVCEWESESGWFNPVVEWAGFVGADWPSEGAGSVSTPMVGPLFDDDGDGDVDGDDAAWIVLPQGVPGGTGRAIHLYPGDGSAPPTVLADLQHPELGALPVSSQAEVALGDVDGDGLPDIVSTWAGSGCVLGAVRTDGTTIWIHEGAESLSCVSHAPALADLEGDGAVEVVFGDQVLEGATGELRWTGGAARGRDVGYGNSGYHSFAADLDGDGVSEVVAGPTIYEADGAIRCSLPTLELTEEELKELEKLGEEPPLDPGADGYAAVADVDGDGVVEVILTGAGLIRTYGPNCGDLEVWDNAGGGFGGPPVVADVDGDGAPEIAVAGRDFIVAYEADGDILWEVETTDESSHSTGAAAFDFDNDGAWEVVYGDEEDIFVLDGATGDVLLQGRWRESGTRNEYVTIADVDGDGSAELLLANERSDQPALFVVGELSSRWAPARAIWSQHAFRPERTGDALEVIPAPAGAAPPAAFRSAVPLGDAGDSTAQPLPAANLEVAAWGVCWNEWGGAFRFWVQVANTGTADQPLPVAVEARGMDATGTLVGQAHVEVPPIAAGAASSVVEGELWVDQDAVPVVLIVEADIGDEVVECDEEDNVTSFVVEAPPESPW